MARFMAPTAEPIFLHTSSKWEWHVKFSSIYIPSDFSEKLVSSKHYQWKVRVYQIEYFNFCLKPININSVFAAALKVSLLDTSHLLVR